MAHCTDNGLVREFVKLFHRLAVRVFLARQAKNISQSGTPNLAAYNAHCKRQIAQQATEVPRSFFVKPLLICYLSFNRDEMEPRHKKRYCGLTWRTNGQYRARTFAYYSLGSRSEDEVFQTLSPVRCNDDEVDLLVHRVFDDRC